MMALVTRLGVVVTNDDGGEDFPVHVTLRLLFSYLKREMMSLPTKRRRLSKAAATLTGASSLSDPALKCHTHGALILVLPGTENSLCRQTK